MDFDIENNVYFLSTNVKPSDKVYFSLSLSMVDSTAGMNAIHFAPISTEAAERLPHGDYDFTEVNTYSDLDISKLELTGHLGINLSDTVGLTFGFLYDDYSDDDPYLVDTTGTVYWAWAGIRFTF